MAWNKGKWGRPRLLRTELCKMQNALCMYADETDMQRAQPISVEIIEAALHAM